MPSKRSGTFSEAYYSMDPNISGSEMALTVGAWASIASLLHLWSPMKWVKPAGSAALTVLSDSGQFSLYDQYRHGSTKALIVGP